MITRLGTYSQVKGVSYSRPCLVATTANITLSGTPTVDGVALTAGDRILVKDQTSGSTNGIYVVSSGTWSRSVDMSVDDDVFTGLQVYITTGSTNVNKNFVLTTSNPITLGSTTLTFTQNNQNYRPWSKVTGTTYTIAVGDENKWLLFTNAVGCTVTAGDSGVMSDGFEYVLTQYGAGTVTVQNSGGAPTLLSPTGNYTTRAQYSTIFLRYKTEDRELLFGGDLT